VETAGLAAGNYIVRLARMDAGKSALNVFQVPASE